MVDPDDVRPTKLLCAWHVTRSFERNILSKLKSNKLKEFAFHHLKTIMTELDEKKSTIMLEQFRKTIELDDNTKKFSKYFEDDYAKRAKEWCYCYRKGLRINTNMAIESMHRIIKQNYFKGKVVKRLDKALSLLLLYLRDKKRDHLIKSYKGKISRKNTNIYNNHQKAVKRLNKFSIDAGNGVYVLSNENEVYTVTVSKENCPSEPCGLKYKDCDICIDLIECTCFENSIHFDMCIHCHIVMLHLRNLCNDSPITKKEAPQQQLPDFDIKDHNDYDPPEHQEQENLPEIEIGDSQSNRETIIAELNKRIAELILITEEIKNDGPDEVCSLAVKIVHRCNLTLKSQSAQKNAEKTSGINPLLVRSRKRKLGHQARSFFSVRKKCKRAKNPLKNPTKTSRKEIVSDHRLQ